MICFLIERVDGAGLDHLMQNLNTLVVKEERPKFLKYAADVLDGGNQRRVQYQNVNGGRLYAIGALSMQGFSKPVRKLLAGNLYHDIDIINCHPTLLLRICTERGWDAPLLRRYVEDRQGTLRAWNTTKREVLVAMYGGKTRLGPFGKEMERIARLISPKDIFSNMSLEIQRLENNVLLQIAAFFKAKGYEIGVYVFDGLMIYRKADKELDLRECEELVGVKLAEKN